MSMCLCWKEFGNDIVTPRHLLPFFFPSLLSFYHYYHSIPFCLPKFLCYLVPTFVSSICAFSCTLSSIHFLSLLLSPLFHIISISISNVLSFLAGPDPFDSPLLSFVTNFIALPSSSSSPASSSSSSFSFYSSSFVFFRSVFLLVVFSFCLLCLFFLL